MTYTNQWTLNGTIFDSDNIDKKTMYGFVYMIINKTTGRKYIGKKLFFFMKTKQIKGMKKRFKSESDWKKYYGSSPTLLVDVEQLGEDNFSRIILHLCKTKAECNYIEAYEQFSRNVLLSDEYYNDWIQVKVTARHIQKVRESIRSKIYQ